jgi:preprotein translocase subunit SecB
MSSSNGSDQNKDNLKLKVDRLYVKEISCKIPHAPGLFEISEFKENIGQLSSSIEMNIKTQTVANQKYEVVLHVIIHGKVKNLSLFTLEAQQAGIFTIEAPVSEIEQIIKTHCTSFLHAYLSQVVTNTITQAGFPPIILQPIIDQESIQEHTLFNRKKEISIGTEKYSEAKY